MFTKFEDIFAELAGRGAKKRMIAAWAVDGHTISAASKAVDLGMIDATLVGDENLIKEQCEKEGIDVNKFTVIHNPSELPAVTQAVTMVNQGMGDLLMKGLCSTDKFMRAIRHAIEVAWNRGRVDTLNRAFGCRVCTPEDKPTNGEFIAMLADKMSMERSA